MTEGPADPLILTVLLDPASQARFDRLRDLHFPSSINYLRAHVTMFHHLPGEQRPAIEARIAERCAGMMASRFTVTGLRFLGRGSAYSLAMPALAALRRSLAQDWSAWLTRQDQQPWQPHVTVQNKAMPAQARQLHATLLAGFEPWEGTATGLGLWWYRGGPWDQATSHVFCRPIVEAPS